MSALTDQEIEAIARRIVADLEHRPGEQPAAGEAGERPGIFATVDEAVEAAGHAQPVFVALPLSTRARIISTVRAALLEQAETLARAAWEETGLGRVEDKIVKNRLVTEKTPGLEDLAPQAVTGDHGLTLMEPAPFGVVGAITPCTNPTSSIICNAIGMLAAGNTVVFNVHPVARACSIQTVALINRAIMEAGGPPNAVTCLLEPTIESAQALMGIPACVWSWSPVAARLSRRPWRAASARFAPGPATRRWSWTKRRTS